MSGAVPPPAARPLEPAARVPRPVCPGCRRASLRAGVARRWDGGRVSPGGMPSAVVRGAWGQALPLPRLPALWAGCPGSLATCCGHGCGCVPHYPLAVGAGNAGMGTRHRPHTARSCMLFGRMRVPGGGASCLGAGRRGTGALPPPTSRPFGRAAGAHYPLALGAGGAGEGTHHQPPSARSCVLWGRHEGARGGRLLPGCGASGDGRSPTPDLSSVQACNRGPLPTGCGCGGCGRGDPSPTRERAPLRAVGAACGCPGGAPLAWVWGVRRRALSHPRPASFRACGRGPLPTGRRCGVRAWAAGCPWHLVPCGGSSCFVRAFRLRGTRWPLWPGTCPRAVVVAGGVPLWCASWPRVGAPLLVRSGRSRCFGQLSRRRGAFPHPGGCRPRLYWLAARGTWRPAKNRALCACRQSVSTTVFPPNLTHNHELPQGLAPPGLTYLTYR